jgi:poly(3-hydroxyalkanoate) synthetase
LENLLADLERGNGRLAITMTDLKAFRLGENIATTPGKIVYQNELMQLIQYTQSTRGVQRRPLLIVPPWINKFYVLDLQPKNSFIKWAVDQGHTVFAISWVNPDEKLAEKGFENYMLEGPLAALDAIGSATGEHNVNAIGYCLGGTLLASTAAIRPRRATTGFQAPPTSRRLSILPTSGIWPSSSTKGSWRLSKDECASAAIWMRGIWRRRSICCAPMT